MFGLYNGTDKHYSNGMILMGEKVVCFFSFDNHVHGMYFVYMMHPK